MRSKIYRLTEFRTSRCISQLAAFFIGTRAKAFTAMIGKESRSGPRPLQERETDRWGGDLPHKAGGAKKGLPCGSTKQKQTDLFIVRMILPQVHLRKPCYDFSFL